MCEVLDRLLGLVTSEDLTIQAVSLETMNASMSRVVVVLHTPRGKADLVASQFRSVRKYQKKGRQP